MSKRRFKVTMDYPVSLFVEAEDEDEAKNLVDFRPLDKALEEAAGPLGAVVGFRYDDIEAEEDDE